MKNVKSDSAIKLTSNTYQKYMEPIRYYDRESKTVLFLPAILFILFYTASQPFTDIVSATQKALVFAVVFSVLVACMFLPDGLIMRPSKYLWKAITGLSFFYLAILIYFIYLDKETVISIIHTYFDRDLERHNYEEVSYGTDCRLYAGDQEDPLANFKHTFFDIFAFAHAAGWLAKTLVARDLKLILMASVTFQIIQFSLRNVLNNFKECWWDHLIVDTLGCNLLGIVIGFYIIDLFKLERYRWSLRDAPLQTSTWNQIKHFFTHWDLSQLEVKSFSSVKKYLQILWYFTFIQINDLNVFFLKYIYQIPPNNYIVITRIVVIGLLCVNASKQYYRFLIQRERELKINCFMVNLIVLTELFLIYKHGEGEFSHAYLTWEGFLLLVGLFVIVLIVLMKVTISDAINIVRKKVNKKIHLKKPENKKQTAKEQQHQHKIKAP